MAPWIVCALVALIIIKPQEFITPLASVPLLYIAFGAALVAIFVDVIWKRLKPALSPLLVLVFAFLVWGLAVTAVKRPDVLADEALKTVILFTVFVAVSIGVGSAKGLKIYAWMWVVCALAVSIVGIVQGFAPRACFVAAADDWEGKGELVFDGRPCETLYECKKDAPDPNANWRCEKPGPWGTSTVGDRVRYRGSLADPNELSLMTVMAIPIAAALFAGQKRERDEEEREDEEEAGEEGRARMARLPALLTDRFLGKVTTMLRAIPAAAYISAIGLVVVLSRSRGGLLVLLLVLAIQFIRKAGAWGVVAGCAFAPPLLLIGGRSGSEAEESADERVQLLREAIDFIRQSKGTGLGMNQFNDWSSIGLTAHNAYILACAELGVVGMLLFGLVMYVGIKTPIVIWFGDYDVDARLKRLSPAIAISLIGAAVGIFFLSWTYKDVLYAMLGASAALYAAARAQDRRVRVAVGVKDVAFVSVAMILVLAAVYSIARIHK